MTKILDLVKSCSECSYKKYYSGGQSECSKLSGRSDTVIIPKDILDNGNIAPFCPLSDYPADIITGQHKTITTLQGIHPKNILLNLFTTWAAILGTGLTKHNELIVRIRSCKEFPDGIILVTPQDSMLKISAHK